MNSSSSTVNPPKVVVSLDGSNAPSKPLQISAAYKAMETSYKPGSDPKQAWGSFKDSYQQNQKK